MLMLMISSRKVRATNRTIAVQFAVVFRFEYDDLVRFSLTVRKNYRRVAYHNWTHGWSVAHAMYVILRMTHIFTEQEVSP